MPRLSMNEMTTYKWTFEEDVARYARGGFAGIGVWRQKLAEFGEEPGLELLKSSGLAVSNLLWAGGFTGSDGRTLKDSVEDGLEAVRLAAALEADCLVVYAGGRAGHTLNHAHRVARDAIRPLLSLADDLGVTLAIEPMHAAVGAEWTFLSTLKDTLAFVDSFRNPRLKIVFDSYHLAQDAFVLDRLEEIAPRIAVVHLGDSRRPPEREQDRCPLGEGTLPLREIIGALTAAGFDGFFDVELIGEEIETSNYLELIRASKETFHQWLPLAVS